MRVPGPAWGMLAARIAGEVWIGRVVLQLYGLAPEHRFPLAREVWPDMPHVFQAYDFPEARDARKRLGAFFRRS